MDRYVGKCGRTRFPLHGRESRPCARYLHASACADAVLIQIGTIAQNVLMSPIQHCSSFLLPSVAFSSPYFLGDPVFLGKALRLSRSLPSDATGISSLLWRLALAQQAVRSSFSFFFATPIASSLRCYNCLRCFATTLPWVFFLCINILFH